MQDFVHQPYIALCRVRTVLSLGVVLGCTVRQLQKDYKGLIGSEP